MESDTEINTDTANEFAWPDSPSQDWWLTQGASLGMSEELIRFTAALYQLGGADARKNSQAAKLASIACDRTAAFRMARSVAVRRLLDMADEIKVGKRPPLTEEQIDRKIDDLIRCPDALTVARGIELREKRKAARNAENAQKEDQDHDAMDRDVICALPLAGWGAALVLGSFFKAYGNIINFKFIREVAPLVAKKFPAEWARWREKHNLPGKEWMLDFLDELAAGPLLVGDELVAAVTAKHPGGPRGQVHVRLEKEKVKNAAT